MEIEIKSILNNGVTSASQYESIARNLKEHPYSSILCALQTIGVKSFDSGKSETQIKFSAIRFQSRAALQKLAFPPEPQLEQSTEAQSSREIEIDTSSKPADSIDELNNLLLSEAVNSGAALDMIIEDATPLPSRAKVTESDQAEIIDQQEEISESVSTIHTETAPPNKQDFGSWMRYLSNENDVKKEETSKILKQEVDGIIDHFIVNESSLVPKRAEFFSPTKAAKGSLIDNEEIVTETLGRIYAGQGAFDKAISTYQKLSLLHPEKSSYFAALIEKLKQENK